MIWTTSRIQGDPTDCDFWERASDSVRIKVIVLALPDHAANLSAVAEIGVRVQESMIAAVALHDDEVKSLKEAGVDAAYNLYEEAGGGLAESVALKLDPTPRPRTA